MARALEDTIIQEFKKTKEEVDFLMEMKQLFVGMLEKGLTAGYILQARLRTLDKKLEENAEKFPALRKLFNKEFIQEISGWNHAKPKIGGVEKASFASHNEGTITETIQQIIKTINLCLLAESIAQSNADLIVISAGSEGSKEQQHPTYAKTLAIDKKVLILNIDPGFIHNTPANGTLNNTQILYFGAPFGRMGKSEKQAMYTEVLSQPFNKASLFCKMVLEQVLSNSKQHILLQGFFNPCISLTPSMPLAHYLGIQFNNKIGVQLEIIGGYDETHPVILHSQEYFLLHKQKLEEIEKSLIELTNREKSLNQDIEALNKRKAAIKIEGDQSKPSADDQKPLDEKSKELDLKFKQLQEEKERLKSKKSDVENDIGRILEKHGGAFPGIKLPENCAKAAKEIAELHYGKLYLKLETLDATELFKASPSLHQKAVVGEENKPKRKP